MTVDGLSLSYAKGNGQVDRTLTGSVNGQPLAIVRGPGASGTPEFNDAVGAALGVHITDSTLDLLETFTDTAPL